MLAAPGLPIFDLTVLGGPKTTCCANLSHYTDYVYRVSFSFS